MIKLKEILDFMNEFCPPELAFDGDNVGLIVGSENKEVSKILITLDVDEKVVKEATELGADAIISHHPLMFHSINKISFTFCYCLI